MNLDNVSVDDGKGCAGVLKYLISGRWELTGAEADELAAAKRWVHNLALQMASHLKPKDPAPAQHDTPSTGFRVKSITHLKPSPSKKQPSKKSKK